MSTTHKVKTKSQLNRQSTRACSSKTASKTVDTESINAEEALHQIEWLLTKKADSISNGDKLHLPPYGNLTELNSSQVIADAVRNEILAGIVGDYLELLDTSSSVYEKDGAYALGIFASGWCRMLDTASRMLCATDDNREALNCGRWLCHESCWTQASKVAVENGESVDIECNGGIRLYAIPIWAGNEIIGSINFGYGDPPRDQRKLQEIAKKYNLSVDELLAQSYAYESRPPYIVEMAKKRLHASARLIGEIVVRKQAEKELQLRTHDLGERVKELNCLYGISALVETPDILLEGILQGAADLIPPSWHYPEITCARIVFEDKEFKTDEFAETDWEQVSDISAHGKRVGAVQVCYLEERPQLDEGPFLKEERHLINAIAERLGRIIERQQAEKALQKSERELAIRNRIANVFLTISDDEEMYEKVLQVVLEVMGSEYGVFGYIDDDGAFVVPSMTRHIWDKCQVSGKDIVFPRDTWGDSTWPRAIRERKVTYTNEPSTNIPEGHISIRRHISLPILYQGESIGLFQVANKETDYEEKDIRILEAIADHIAPILDARLQRDRKEKERKLAEEQLKNTMSDLARSNRELEQFAYVASHDLQEPLRKIRAFGDRVNGIYQAGDYEKGRDYIGRMQSAAQRMQNLIDSLLTFSRVTTEKQPFVPVNLNDVAQVVVSDLGVQIEKVGATVEVKELPTIEADPAQMRQLFQNLISNGLKFHREEEKPFVKVYSRILKTGYCQISVEDKGIGFEQQYLDRIFTVFQRLHGRLEYEGTGIGLAIARKITDLHGGIITAESTPGQGSTFIVILPARQKKGAM